MATEVIVVRTRSPETGGHPLCHRAWALWQDVALSQDADPPACQPMLSTYLLLFAHSNCSQLGPTTSVLHKILCGI